MTRFFLYLLLASELVTAACWYIAQWRDHQKRRQDDLISFTIYAILALSFFAYGSEILMFDIASPIGYAADIALAIVMGLSILRKVFPDFRLKHLKK